MIRNVIRMIHNLKSASIEVILNHCYLSSFLIFSSFHLAVILFESLRRFLFSASRGVGLSRPHLWVININQCKLI